MFNFEAFLSSCPFEFIYNEDEILQPMEKIEEKKWKMCEYDQFQAFLKPNWILCKETDDFLKYAKWYTEKLYDMGIKNDFFHMRTITENGLKDFIIEFLDIKFYEEDNVLCVFFKERSNWPDRSWPQNARLEIYFDSKNAFLKWKKLI